MSIFNSLGSNYTLWSALRALFSFGGNAKEELTTYLEKRYGGDVILTYKGRDAMRLALEALPEKGSIAVNGYTCLAVDEAVRGSGNTPLYLDIAKGTMDFSADAVRRALTPQVKAVVVQNTLGFPCDIASIGQVCREYGLVLIEDLAHSIGTRYADGREAGTVGDLVVLTFSQDKVVDAVSGGALIARNDSLRVIPPRGKVAFVQQLKDRSYPILTWKIRAAYLLGIGRPFHALLRALGILSSPFGKKHGPRSLPTWYCRNILRQYRRLDRTASHRKAIADIYASGLHSTELKVATEGATNLRFPLLIENREALIEHLREHGVHVSDIWYDAPVAPRKYMHQSGYRGGCPNAEYLAERMLNLPTHINVSAEDAVDIVRLVNDFVAEQKMYSVREVEEGEWESFIQKEKPRTFLQSWLWGAYNEATGSGTFRLGVLRGNELVGAGLFLKVVARRGSFLLCPHGPVLADDGALAPLMRRATAIARKERCDFVRVCPLSPATPENSAIYRTMGFLAAPIHMHPELAWMLDITKPEEELLRDMRKTTRYTIKKMEKEGVGIEMSSRAEDIEKFWPVYQATAERQQYTPFKKSDLRKEFELFAKNDNAAFFFGKQGGEIVAAAMIIFYNGQAFYHHSGSLPSGSNVSYLLQWRVIQEAKRRGCTLYNFWGISPADRPKHPWAGLSLFKKGFGGFAEEYLHAQDKPLTAKYWLNYAVETIRRVRRGL